MSNELDIFGEFLMKHFRDNAIHTVEALIAGKMNAPSLHSLQAAFGAMGDADQGILKKTCMESFDAGLHDFVFALQEASDNNQNIKVLVNGRNVAELSDGLQGELFTEDGWLAKYSAHGGTDA